jgi:hypothetical protein
MRHGAISTTVFGVLAAAAAAGAQVTSFTSQSAFEAHMQGGGNTLLGVEDFEDFNLGEFEYWEGDAVTLAATGLITPGLVPSANWGNALTVNITRATDVVNVNGPTTVFGIPTSTLTVDPTVNGEGTADLHFGTISVVNDVATMNYEGVTGFGLRLYDISASDGLVVRVFGEDGETFLAEFFGVEASAVTGSFFGVAATVPIGRVNLHNGLSGNEIVDDVQMWLPGGCDADLNNDQMVDVFDLLSYLDMWFAGDAAAELTGDDPASIDVFDLLAYLDGWFAGC